MTEALSIECYHSFYISADWWYENLSIEAGDLEEIHSLF